MVPPVEAVPRRFWDALVSLVTLTPQTMRQRWLHCHRRGYTLLASGRLIKSCQAEEEGAVPAPADSMDRPR